jgi:Lanthionine synthetase C-like protein
MRGVLFTPANHEPLIDAAWDESRARAAIGAILDDTESACGDDGFWPEHPDDRDEDGTSLRTGVYMGAAGLLWGLHRFGRDHAEAADRLHASYLREPDWPGVVPGYWAGEAGMLLAAQQMAPTAERAELLLTAIDANADNETNELMWGSPGTMLVARSMFEATGERRWADAWLRSAELLWSRWLPSDEHGCRLWTQQLYGRVWQFIGPGHGLAGNVFVLSLDAGLLGDERRAELERRAVEAATALALRDGPLANWPAVTTEPMVSTSGGIRTQWCHGAPGMVASLARIATADPDFSELLVAGGDLTWQAGPLAKGAGLCHGTAGNGCAFLALFERLGDEQWLERARRFAMHAVSQVEASRERHGFGRHSLWTGDMGVALYLQQCIDGRAGMPSLDLL